MPSQPITLEALEVLDVIARKGSFAAAASTLYKVPSSITYTINKLEQDLGVTLFIKQGRRSVLTPAGSLLLEQGREILAAAKQLAEVTREIDSGWESSLNIAIDTTLGVQHIFPLIEKFYAIKPDLEINIYQEALAGGWEALCESRVELAIGLPERPRDISGFHSEPYQNIHWVFAVHPKHPLARVNKAISKQDIEPHRMIVVRDSSRNHATLSHRIFSKQPLLRVPSVQHKIAAQIKGLGVGYLPKYLIEKHLETGELQQLDVKGVDNRSTQYIAWPKGKKGKALKWFIDQLSSIPSA